ncbi:MAG: hypothetical protein QGF87_08780, partial [Woeseiaceae bacterium]|nr:hypothetical protein [Woeseiaceae bacterium]
MTNRLVLLLVVLLAARSALADSTAFVNVNVIPMTGDEVLPAQTVVVDNGIIVTVGAVDDTAVPDSAYIIDGTDRYLIPGLAEMHGHVPGGSSANLERILAL